MAVIGLTACTSSPPQSTTATLKETFKDQFLMGVAMNTWQVAGLDTAATNIVKKHFNSIVAENCMKCEVIHP